MDKSTGAGNVISLPKGGGAISGIGETFSADLFTGTGNFNIPIALPPGRNGFQPSLSLTYSTGNGNGPFGLGWSLSVPGVSRKTSKGVPQYRDDKDVFILFGAEDLVPVEGEFPNPVRYRPRTEGMFALIRFLQSDNRWEVTTKDGLVSLYGNVPGGPRYAATVSDPSVTPGTPPHVFSWSLVQTRDTFGNVIEYDYDRDSPEVRVSRWDQLYLQRIRYVDYDGQRDREGNPPFLVSVTFNYSEPAERPDHFSSHRAGFEIRTRKRCTSIEVQTHAEQTRLVRTYHLTYVDERTDLESDDLPLNGVSLLSQVRVVGHDLERENEQERHQELPPLELRYSRFAPDTQRFFAVEGQDLPARSLASPDLELVDLFGNGLPDLLEMNGTVRFWRNLGNGRFDLPRSMTHAPAGLALADPGVQLIDANGDGHVDLLVTSPPLAGYFPSRPGGLWDERSFQRYDTAPSFSLEDVEVALVDVDGDGVTDAIRSGTRLEHFFNDPRTGWSAENTMLVPRTHDLAIFPDVTFSDQRVRFADLSGDGLKDIVLLYDGNVEYWPSLGRGNWGARVGMTNSPRFPHGYDVRRILLADVDGDGLDDLVYVDDRKVLLFINQSGKSWTGPIQIDGTPGVTDRDAVRLVDLLGTGISGVLWSKDATLAGRSHMFFLDFTGGVKPYLLDEINNRMGARTLVEYAPSTRFYLSDEIAPSTRWRTSLPFPVNVVARVEIVDAFSRGKLTTEYVYHHGYWDGAEREFRGFGRVDQRDTQTFRSYHSGNLHPAGSFRDVEEEHFSPPTELRAWFHLGPVGEEFGDWRPGDFGNQQFHEGFLEYFSGDPTLLPALGSGLAEANPQLGFPAGLPRRVARDAIRALRGRLIRTELYSHDGIGNQARPFTVSETLYAVSAVDGGGGLLHDPATLPADWREEVVSERPDTILALKHIADTRGALTVIGQTSYDIRGNVTKVKDALDRLAVEYVYDLDNHVLRSTTIDTGTRRLVLDAAGKSLERRDGRGALTLQAYDRLNRRSRLWARDDLLSPLTLRERLEYGDEGNPSQDTQARQFNGAVNRLGALHKHYDEAGLVELDEYDFKGNIVEKRRRVIRDDVILHRFPGRDDPSPDWNIRVFRVDWDPVKEQEASLLGETAHRTSVTYDALNRIERMLYPEAVDGDRRELGRQYNRAGALERLTLNGTVFVDHIAYDAKGRRTLVARGNSVMTLHAYDPRTSRLKRLLSTRFTKPDERTFRPLPLASTEERKEHLHQDLAYEYDLVGNVTSIHDRTPESGVPNALTGADALDRRFEHDAIYRLASATGRECDGPAEQLFDVSPRCVDLTRTRAYRECYRYDALGNMERLRHAVTTSQPNTNGFVREFTHRAGTNQLAALESGSWRFDYTHDANGNVTSETTSRHFEWDQQDRLKAFRNQTHAGSVAGDDGLAEPTVHAHYLYDSAGMRVKKLLRKQGGQIEVVEYIDGVFEVLRASGIRNNQLHLMDGSSRVATLLVGAPFPDDGTPSIKYHLADHLGSSNVVVDRHGTLVNREEYTPYGETSFGSFARKRYRFTGKERDDESGLCNHGARYYSSVTARYRSVDPKLHESPGWSPYCYARANPVTLLDADGRSPETAKATLGKIISEGEILVENAAALAHKVKEQAAATEALTDPARKASQRLFAKDYTEEFRNAADQQATHQTVAEYMESDRARRSLEWDAREAAKEVADLEKTLANEKKLNRLLNELPDDVTEAAEHPFRDEGGRVSVRQEYRDRLQTLRERAPGARSLLEGALVPTGRPPSGGTGGGRAGGGGGSGGGSGPSQGNFFTRWFKGGTQRVLDSVTTGHTFLAFDFAIAFWRISEEETLGGKIEEAAAIEGGLIGGAWGGIYGAQAGPWGALVGMVVGAILGESAVRSFIELFKAPYSPTMLMPPF